MRRVLVLLACLVLAAAGCGGDDGRSADERAAAAVVAAWIDDDDCGLLSDRYAKEGYRTVAAGRRACERERPGLGRGEYSLGDVHVDGDRARVGVTVDGGAERTYAVVRGGRRGWLVDGRRERRRGAVGAVFTHRDAYLLNDERVDIETDYAVTAVEDDAQPPADRSGPGKGHRWVRVEVSATVRGPDRYEQPVDDFALIDAEGETHGPGPEVFVPSFGSGLDIVLAPGERAQGNLSFRVRDGTGLRAVRFRSGVTGSPPLVWRIGPAG